MESQQSGDGTSSSEPTCRAEDDVAWRLGMVLLAALLACTVLLGVAGMVSTVIDVARDAGLFDGR